MVGRSVWTGRNDAVGIDGGGATGVTGRPSRIGIGVTGTRCGGVAGFGCGVGRGVMGGGGVGGSTGGGATGTLGGFGTAENVWRFCCSVRDFTPSSVENFDASLLAATTNFSESSGSNPIPPIFSGRVNTSRVSEEFLMGTEDGYDFERPVHRVTLDPFEMGGLGVRCVRDPRP